MPTDHGQGSQTPQDRHQVNVKGWEGGNENAQEGSEPGSLGTNRHETGHRGGSSLVDIRRPHVERDGSDLEPKADQDQGRTDGEQEGRVHPREGTRKVDDRDNSGEGGVARGAEDQCDAVDNETGGKSSQQEILDPGFFRLYPRAGEG